MKNKKRVRFKIEHLDPMGQGVFKNTENSKIYFIKKTIEEEEGDALISRENKHIVFAELENPSYLKTISEKRIQAECIHYDHCNGCRYLHLSYENEVLYKKNSLEREFKTFIDDKKVSVSFLGSKDRFRYRNRVQLHYDKIKRKLGFMNDKNIIEVPSCLLPNSSISNKIKELYVDDNWLKLKLGKKNKGHIEISSFENKIKVNINKPYSEDGFIQVNEEMNSKIQNIIKNIFKNRKNIKVLDLFGGSGNLSKELNDQIVDVVDCTDQKINENKMLNHQTYHMVDIYNESQFEMFMKNRKYDILLIDPPRSGLKHIDKLLEYIHPKEIIYLSCKPSTLKRDLSKMDGYSVRSIRGIDMFPGTFHIESMVHLEKV